MDDEETDTIEYIKRYYEEQKRYEYEKYRACNIEGD